MNAYSEEYLKTWEIIEEHYFTKSDPYAKRLRDRRARQLRKEGYIVECKKWDFPDIGTGSMYIIDAKRRREE